MAERTGGLRVVRKNNPQSLKPFGLKPWPLQPMVVFWLFWPPKWTSLLNRFYGVKKTKSPVCFEAAYGEYQAWCLGELAKWRRILEIDCLIGSLRGESPPHVLILIQFFLGFTGGKYSSWTWKTPGSDKAGGCITWKEQLLTLGLSCSKVILENAWRDGRRIWNGVAPP